MRTAPPWTITRPASNRKLAGGGELLPGFIRYDAAQDRAEALNPGENNAPPKEPAQFGDNWSEPLQSPDRDKISKYFRAIERLSDFLDFITFRVGGVEHTVEFAGRKFRRGITFDAPRNSLMIAIENEIFDDMLIGNFMKTTLHGKFPPRVLYPDFTPYVTKYADNGLARSQEDLRQYFAQYREQAPLAFVRHRLELRGINAVRNFVEPDTPLYTLAARTYHWLKAYAPG